MRYPKRDLLLDGVLSGAGDEEASLLNGLRVGNLESIEIDASEDNGRVGGAVLAYGLGVVRVRGLKLCPTSELLVLTEEFHLGLLSAGLAEDRGRRVF